VPNSGRHTGRPLQKDETFEVLETKVNISDDERSLKEGREKVGGWHGNVPVYRHRGLDKAAKRIKTGLCQAAGTPPPAIA